MPGRERRNLNRYADDTLKDLADTDTIAGINRTARWGIFALLAALVLSGLGLLIDRHKSSIPVQTSSAADSTKINLPAFRDDAFMKVLPETKEDTNRLVYFRHDAFEEVLKK